MSDTKINTKKTYNLNEKEVRRLDKYFNRNNLCWKYIQLSTNDKNNIFAFNQMMYHCEKARDKFGKLRHKLDNFK
jgi:hypothetical protein